MYSTTDRPEHVHRMKKQGGGLEGSSTGKKGSTIGEKMEHMKEKMGMKK